ncbi:MAG: nucleotidyltransferase family protein [Dehalococcoidia bacterium]
MKINGNIDIPDETIADFCRRWKITQIELFGSALRDDFRPDSDIDLLVTFQENDGWGLYEFVEMKDELVQMFGRPVDLIERAAVEKSRNPFRRKNILSTAQVVYRVA